MNLEENIKDRLEIYYKDIFKDYNIILLIFTLCLLLYLSKLDVIKSYSLDIYQGALFIAAYDYINNLITPYKFLMGGFIVSFTTYIIYTLFHDKLNIVILNALIAIVAILAMDITKSFNLSALVYAFLGVSLIPSLKKGYLFSYLLGAVIIIIISTIIKSIYIYAKKITVI